MNHSFTIALGGILTALALVCMFIAPLVPVAVYLCTTLSGICIAVAAFEIGNKYALCVYSAASFLSLLLIADKETAFIFILTFGIYPIYKNLLEKSEFKLKNRELVVNAFKLLFLSVSCSVCFFLSVTVLGVPTESYMIGELYLPGVIILMEITLCMMYDKALDNIIIIYKLKFRKNILRKW